MYNSVECKNSVDIVCFLYKQNIKGYTFIMSGLQETFIGSWGLIKTLNKKQSAEGKRGRQKGG